MSLRNEKNIILGLLSLALLLLPVFSMAADYDSSASVFRFQKKMAEKGYAESQYKLAMMYESGSGVEQNLQTARIWYGRASYQNYKPARNRLTYLDIKQNGFKKHHNEWLTELKREAEFNDGESLFLLGQMYSEGIGVQKSLTKAAAILRKAAAGNIPGSDAEITRIEKELHDLQQQYQEQELALKKQQQAKQKLEQENKERQKRLAAIKKRQQLDARKAQQAKQQAIRKQRLLEQQKRQLTEQKRQAAEAAKQIQPPPAIEPVPDTSANAVCSGRNRFSPTCR
ncbi:MAG: hypothetical protein OQL06_01880 [Gammaproteobacteria bacterium]|nr:hypothetical protein [Gammaproteobacteria bacterium]